MNCESLKIHFITTFYTGFTVQWGISTKTGVVTVTFPRSFSTTVYSVCVSSYENIGDADTTCAYNYSKTGFTSNNRWRFSWIAMGIS